MTAETTTLTRELDRRLSDGIEVRLLWHARLDADPTHNWLRETILNCW